MDVQEMLDRESIRRVLARYTLHGDRGGVDELVACFAPEGVLEFENEWVAHGRDAIRERVTASIELTARCSVGAVLLRHHVSTQGIERVSAAEARAWSYFTAMTGHGPDHFGRYIDELCRVGEEWMIRRRLVRVEWWSPRTVYADEAKRSRARLRRKESERVLLPSSNDVSVDVRERVGWITLHHDRLEGEMREQLLSALHRLSDDPAVRCIAIASAGAAFSAGANVDDMLRLQRRGDSAEILRRMEIGARIVRAIRETPKPVVAVLDGVAAGAGTNLALACDLRVGSSRAAFVSSYVRIGLLPDWGGLHFLVQRIGIGRAADLMMTGRRIDAARAFQMGLLEHLFPDDSFEDDVRRLLDRLAAAPREALAEIKRGLEIATEGGLEAVLSFEAEMQPRLFRSDDCREGLQAFLEKRSPKFGD